MERKVFTTQIIGSLSEVRYNAGRGVCVASGLPIGKGEPVRVVLMNYSPSAGKFIGSDQTGLVYREDVLLRWRFRPVEGGYLSDFQAREKLAARDVEERFPPGAVLDVMSRALLMAHFRREAGGAVTALKRGARGFSTFDGWWSTIGQHALAFRVHLPTNT